MKKLFALVDANSFYASCERIFDPKLIWKPVVVLSNNDGCAVARTQEAKDLWVKMWTPYFKIKEEFWDAVIAKSSHYQLYWEISNRFHTIVWWYASGQEIYSIDESFLDFTFVPDVKHTMAQIYARCKRDLSLPVCVWVWSTKTRAKLANHIAKKNPEFFGRCDLESLPHETVKKYMRLYDVWDVWWIWRKNKDRLEAMWIYSIYDLQQSNPFTMKSLFSVVMAKTVRELNWESCLELEEISEDKQQIMCSRSFWEMISELDELIESITLHATRAWEKLRQQDSRAGSISVFVQSNRHRKDLIQYWRQYTYTFSVPTNDTKDLIQWAIEWLRMIYLPWIMYKKSGILLSNLESWDFEQVTLFWEQSNPKRKKLMETLDRLNSKHWKQSVFFASQWIKNSWDMRCNNKSPSYLHKITDVPTCI